MSVDEWCSVTNFSLFVPLKGPLIRMIMAYCDYAHFHIKVKYTERYLIYLMMI